jgi:hypothetical protein
MVASASAAFPRSWLHETNFVKPSWNKSKVRNVRHLWHSCWSWSNASLFSASNHEIQKWGEECTMHKKEGCDWCWKDMISLFYLWLELTINICIDINVLLTLEFLIGTKV